MSADKYDTNQPILILVRRGRGGRGYLVSPVDAPTDVAACSSANEIGDVVLELLDDEKQPRVNIDEIVAMANGDAYEEDGEEEDGDEGDSSKRGSRSADSSDGDMDESDSDDSEDEDEDEEDEADKPWWDIRGAEDPADQVLVNILGGVLGKAQKLSNQNKSRRRRHRRPTKKRK
jgi:hypothetical protein